MSPASILALHAASVTAAVVAGDASHEYAQARDENEQCSKRSQPTAIEGSQQTHPKSSQADSKRQESDNHDPRLLRIERRQCTDVLTAWVVRILCRPPGKPCGAEEDRTRHRNRTGNPDEPSRLHLPNVMRAAD